MVLFCSYLLCIWDLIIFFFNFNFVQTQIKIIILLTPLILWASSFCKTYCQLPFTMWLLKFNCRHLRIIFFCLTPLLYPSYLSFYSLPYDTSHHRTDYPAFVPLHYILSVLTFQIIHCLGQGVPTVMGLYRIFYNGALILVGLFKCHHHKHD